MTDSDSSFGWVRGTDGGWMCAYRCILKDGVPGPNPSGPTAAAWVTPEIPIHD